MNDLLARDLVVVTGKGGVGKTTVAAAIGIAAAARGQRVVVAEVSARDDVSRALSGSAAGVFRERAIGDGLHHVSIDPEHAMEEYLVDQLPSRTLADVLAKSKIFTYLAAATPGMRELLTVGKVWELAQPDRRTPGAQPYDLVVLDAPATGHGVAILTAPRTFADAARVGPVARQGAKIAATLSDPAKTAIVAVATPEEMPVNETLALRRTLIDDVGQDVMRVVVNGLMPDRLTNAEAERLTALGDDVAASVALSHHRRARAQRTQLSRLKRGLGGDVAVTTLPMIVAPRLGAPELTALSRRLA